MLSPMRFSADVARRAQALHETLEEAGHAPDSLRVSRDNPTRGNLVEATFSVEDAAAGVDKATTLLEDLQNTADTLADKDLPDNFYMDEEGSEVGPVDLGVVWKAREEPEDETEETLATKAWAGSTPSDFPELWEELTDHEHAPGLATLVELMAEHVEDHTLERIRAAVAEECTRREAWDSFEGRRSVRLGSRLFIMARAVPGEDPRPPNVAETSDEDPRGGA